MPKCCTLALANYSQKKKSQSYWDCRIVKCKRKGSSLDTSQAYRDTPLCSGMNLNKIDFNYVK